MLYVSLRTSSPTASIRSPFFAYVITFFCVYHHPFLRMSSPFFASTITFFTYIDTFFYLHRHLFLPTSSPFLPRASPCVYVYHHLCFTFALAPLNHLYFTFLIQLADPHEYNTRLSQLLYICIYISIYTHAYVHTYIYICIYTYSKRTKRRAAIWASDACIQCATRCRAGSTHRAEAVLAALAVGVQLYLSPPYRDSSH